MKNNFAGAVMLLFILGMSLWLAGPAKAEDLGLNSRNSYDIYVASAGQEPTIIRNVQLTGLRQVGNKVFVVIQTDDFSGKRSEGLVALDSIQAILPTFSATVPPGSVRIQPR